MSRCAGEDRRRSLARLWGADAERVAMVVLMLKGFRLLARGYRGRGGEIDLVMRRGALVIAVEVKARATMEAAAEAVTPGKIARIAAGMRQFRSERGLGDDLTYRCDAVLIAPGRLPRHVPDVGTLDS
jgi:putative endonuclease